MTGKITLSAKERSYLRELNKTQIFSIDEKTTEAVAPVHIGGVTRGYVWIYPDDSSDRTQLHKSSGLYAYSRPSLASLACTIFASLMARSIARPLGVLMKATRQLIQQP